MAVQTVHHVWKCDICNNYFGTDLKSIVYHIRRVHNSSNYISYYCPVPRCFRKFQKYDTMYRHLKKDHLEILNDQQQCRAVVRNGIDDDDNDDGQEDGGNQFINNNDSAADDDGMNDDIQNDSDSNSSDNNNIDDDDEDSAEGQSNNMVDPDAINSEALQLVLCLRRNKIPQTLVDEIIKRSSGIFGTSIDICTSIVTKNLEGANVNAGTVKQIQEEAALIVNPFSSMNTKYLQDKLLDATLLLVKPKEIILGNALRYKHKNGKSILEEFPETFIFVSVIEILQQMLCNNQLYEELIGERNHTSPGVYYDIFDGKYFKDDWCLDMRNHPCFYILIFQDALELCNPLGNRSGKHKVVMFYWTLVNISPKFRSRLCSIQLFAMVKKKVLDKFEDVLKPFFKEMDRLSQGVDFMINDEVVRCYGKVLLCLGDTEGQHQIGGFKVGVGFSYRKCRFCYATVNDVRNNFNPNSFISRTKESYLNECKLITDAPNARVREELKITYGLITKSCLVNLKDFDVIKQMPHDVMHVLLEGVVPYECQLVLSTFIEQHLFTLDEFNHQLDIFQFTYSDAKSKPEPLKKSVFVTGERKLKYSAENARVFLKIIPFILEKFVHEDDVFFKFLLQLLNIVQIVYSPVISDGTCGVLEHLIIDHLSDFNNLFPESNLIPKHHYLLEIPRYIPMFGPPVRYCCMRFEALHKVFKSFVPVISFRTLCLSLSTKYMKFTCEENWNDPEHSILKSSRVDGPGKMVPNYLLTQYKIDFPELQTEDFIYSLNWVVYCGTKFIADKCVVAVGADPESHLPVFGSLLKILLYGEKIVFLVQTFTTERFEENFMGYSVTPANTESIWFLQDLLDYNVYQDIETLSGDKVIPLKYDLTDLIEEHILHCNPLHEK